MPAPACFTQCLSDCRHKLAIPPYPPISCAFLARSLAQDLHLCTGKCRLQTAFGEILALCVYNIPKGSTISRVCLHVADCVYRLQTAFTCARVNPPAVPRPPHLQHTGGQLRAIYSLSHNSTTTDLGNVTQGHWVSNNQVSHICGAQHFQAFRLLGRKGWLALCLRSVVWEKPDWRNLGSPPWAILWHQVATTMARGLQAHSCVFSCL